MAALRLETNIQEVCLALLCFSQPQCRVIASIVPVADYDPFFREVAQAATSFLDRFDAAPGDHTLDLILDLKSSNRADADIYQRVYEAIQTTFNAGINAPWAIDESSKFVRKQRMRLAWTKATELLEQDKKGDRISEAVEIVVAADRQAIDLFEVGTFLSDKKKSLKFLDNRADVFPMGINEFDYFGIAPARKTMFTLLGLPGTGKSWGAVHMGKQAMQVSHAKVLHVTLEMSEAQVSKRYLQMLFSITNRKANVVYHKISGEKNEDGSQSINLDRDELTAQRSFEDDDIDSFLVGKLKGLERRTPILIKQFPTGGLTIKSLEQYMDGLERLHKFIPDLLIIDYPDLFDIPSKDYRSNLSKVYVKLRGLGVERNIAVLAMSQSNKMGLDKTSLKKGSTPGVLNEGNLAEDWSKAHISDIIMTYNQTDVEYQMGLARLFAAKVREDQKHQLVCISQAYPMGQFCLSSAVMRGKQNYWQQVEYATPSRN